MANCWNTDVSFKAFNSLSLINTAIPHFLLFTVYLAVASVLGMNLKNSVQLDFQSILSFVIHTTFGLILSILYCPWLSVSCFTVANICCSFTSTAFPLFWLYVQISQIFLEKTRGLDEPELLSKLISRSDSF